eukprot:gene14576-16151_t
MIRDDETINPVLNDDTIDEHSKKSVSSQGDLSHRKSQTSQNVNSYRSSGGSRFPADPPDAKDRASVLKYTAGYIIVTEFCERLAYYGFAGSLVLFFQTQLNYSNAEADVQYSAWSGFCYVTPLLGGYIADTYLGRYQTILLFCSIYLVGLIMVVIGSIPGEVNAAFFFPAIYIIALGTGGIKPNVSTMGADQFDDRYSRDRKEKESFFNWFYWSINLGSMISYTVIAYICQYGIPQLGGADWGFFVGYLIPAIFMGVAIFVFVLGTPKYRRQRPQGSVLVRSLKICYEAVITKAKVSSVGMHVLDKAKDIYGGSYTASQVDGVKLVTRLTPFLLVMIPYWGIYSQMSTAFQNQGCQMDLSFGDILVPVSALNTFDTVAILLLVPLFDGVIYPYFKRKGIPLSMLQKMGWGFACAILAMLIAAVVEIARLEYAPAAGNYYDKSARDNITPCQSIDDFNPYRYQDYLAGVNDVDSQPANCHQTCSDYYQLSNVTYLNLTCIDCDNIPQMSHLSVFWQIFQFVVIGMSEILASITSLEFFYSQAPTVMRSVTQSLNLATSAAGSFLMIPLLLLVNVNPNDEWVPTNLDDGHLDWYFFLLAGFMALTMIYFYYISKDYEYKTIKDLQIFESEEGSDDDSGKNLLSPSQHAVKLDESSHEDKLIEAFDEGYR